MIDGLTMTSEEGDAEECGRPCDPAHPCENCYSYWNRMRREGYWTDTKGWTWKGFREMLK